MYIATMPFVENDATRFVIETLTVATALLVLASTYALIIWVLHAIAVCRLRLRLKRDRLEQPHRAPHSEFDVDVEEHIFLV